MTKRTSWLSFDLGIKDEPLARSLWEYRQWDNRVPVVQGHTGRWIPAYPNLVSSITDDGKQMPILDMDFPHHIEQSTTPGHSHLYIDVPMSKVQWLILMCALRFAGVIELGFFVWSIRRGGNFVRVPGVHKVTPEEINKPNYGWFFRLRKKN
jgi:hypothetical protein